MATDLDDNGSTPYTQSSVRDEDGDSVEMEEFCIVERDNVEMTIINGDKTDTMATNGTQPATQDTEMDEHQPLAPTHGQDKEKRERFAKDRHEQKTGSHINPAFEDDDGYIVLAEAVDGNTGSKSTDTTTSAGGQKTDNREIQSHDSEHGKVTVSVKTYGASGAENGAHEMADLKDKTPKPRGHVQFSTNNSSSIQTEPSHATQHKSAKKDTSWDHSSPKDVSENVTVIIRNPNGTSGEISTSSGDHALGNKIKMPLTRPRRTGEHGRGMRPHSRSISSFPFPTDLDLSADATKNSVGRSQSMRIPPVSAPKKEKPRRLLRDLSFSDADVDTLRNYGSLRGGQALPRRKPPRQADKENIITEEDSNEGTSVKFTAELKSHMLDLMQELVTRGKVHQVAVLEQDTGNMLVSWPAWTLSHQDQVGLVKAVMLTHQPMLKMKIGNESYNFFKHGGNKMVGRAGDNVLVADKSDTCVVVGVSDDNVPGSCLYEVSELVETLVQKGW